MNLCYIKRKNSFFETSNRTLYSEVSKTEDFEKNYKNNQNEMKAV